MKENPSSNPRRKYNAQFKREAVKHWLGSGKSAPTIAQELGITTERLYAWKQRFSPTEAADADDLRAQLEVMRQELARVTEQRDILKKTLGIVSEPPPKGMSGSKP
jgi:transposase-like protein